MAIPLSVLDLSLIVEGGSAPQALHNTLDLAQQAERLGYTRYWVAEHHNMDGVASSATAVLVGQIAASTQTIRVGSGGVMLPNHAPLVVAEQFGTLASFFPDRIDLGLGRAPGTDRATMLALRRRMDASDDDFPRDVVELQHYLAAPDPAQAAAVRAIPGIGTEVPIWLLGSSLYSAQLAAYLGLPFAFASHFAPDYLMQALEVYRSTYRPSARWPKPYAAVGVNVVVAPTDDESAMLFTSLRQRFLGMQRGRRGPLPRPVPVAEFQAMASPQEHAGVDRMLAASFCGSPQRAASQLHAFAQETGANEFIVACAVHSHALRVRSYELLAQAWAGLPEEATSSAAVPA
jgi:luciferase family oxidoreductase group 1